MRTTLILSLAALLTFAGASPLAAQTPPTEQLLARIKEKSAGHTTLAARFERTQRLPALTEEVKSAGDLYYAKPDRMVMRFTLPAGEFMLMDGDRFTMASGGRMRRTTGKANPKMSQMKQVLTAAFDGDLARLGATTITRSDLPAAYRLTLELPAGPAEQTFAVKLTVAYSKADFTIDYLYVEEPDGTTSAYTFTDKEPDATIEARVFTATK